jgi:hypothetical protein
MNPFLTAYGWIQEVSFMVVMTMKAKIKWLVVAVLVVISAVVVAVVLFRGATGEAWATVADIRYSCNADDEEGRIAFFQQFGWTVEEEPVEVEEVVIPTTWNDVYENYNLLQQEQGLDLTPYQGKTCKRWVYQVLNYPRSDQRVLATILVLDGKVIGGDISSANLDGFMATFLGEHGLMAGGEDTSSSETGSAVETAALPETAYPTD